MFIDAEDEEDEEEDEEGAQQDNSGAMSSSSSASSSSSSLVAGPSPSKSVDGITYPPMEGLMKKRGGGYSFMGSKAWKERYFVAKGALRWSG